MAKTVIVDGYEFVTNNFAAILDKPSAPEAFHAVQDFLRSSSIGYALVQPESISPTAVIAIWSTAEVEEEVIKFKYADKEYVITSEVVRQDLRLPEVTSHAPLYPDEKIKSFIQSLGYNGDTSKLGKLVRAKLRKEWNFYFDCIAKCFTNKSSNFDALTQTAQQIGYCLLNNADFDYASLILEYISMRINDKRQVIYVSRFLYLIFVHLIPDVVIQNENCIKVYKNGPRSFVDIANKDVKNKFNTPIDYPQQFLALLQERLPEVYGARVQETTEGTHSESNPSTHPKHTPKQSAPSGISQKVPVAKRRRIKHRAQKGRGSPAQTSSEETPIHGEDVGAAGIPITQIVDGGEQADKDTDSEDNMPIGLKFCVKRRVEDSTAEVPKTPQTKRLKVVTSETLERMGLVTESAKKRRAEGDLSPMRVYKKQRSRRSLSHSEDTQEPGTQSVSDIQDSPMMDPQEPGAQSVPDIHQTEVEGTEAAAQGASPDKAANSDEQTVPVPTAIPDEGANPDEGATPDGKTTTDEAINADAASTAVEEATQEPFTQSVKEGQAPQEPSTQSVEEGQATQEPPAQSVGESLTVEAESGMFLNLPSFNFLELSVRMNTGETLQVKNLPQV